MGKLPLQVFPQIYYFLRTAFFCKAMLQEQPDRGIVNGNIIIELKAINHIDTPHRRQLWNYMNLTHLPYGMLINFSPDGLYSEWYHRNESTGNIDKIKLL